MNLLSIPVELQMEIIYLLPPKDRLRMSQTCHSLHRVVFSGWKKLSLTVDQILFDRTYGIKKHLKRCCGLQELVITGKHRRVDGSMLVGVVLAANRTTLKKLSIELFEESLNDHCMYRLRRQEFGRKFVNLHLNVNGKDFIINEKDTESDSITSDNDSVSSSDNDCDNI